MGEKLLRINHAPVGVAVRTPQEVLFDSHGPKCRVRRNAFHFHGSRADGAFDRAALGGLQRLFQCRYATLKLLNFCGQLFQAKPRGDFVKDFQYV